MAAYRTREAGTIVSPYVATGGSDPPAVTQVVVPAASRNTPKSVETMRGIVERFVDEFLDTWQGRSDVDLIADFGFLLPANVIATNDRNMSSGGRASEP